jgi:lipooligosaccharide transport system permease protein
MSDLATESPGTVRSTRTHALPGPVDRALPALRVTEYYARLWQRYWVSWALTAMVLPLLFLGALGLGLGGLVDEVRTVDGFEYLVFVAPGILAASGVFAASGDSLWPVLGGIKWNRVLHGVAATPVTPGQIYAGFLTWTITHVAMNAAVFLVVAALLGAVESWWAVVAVPAAALGALACAAPLTAFAAGRDSDSPFAVTMRVLVIPMFLFSGTFYPIDQLPDALEWLARVAPLWHAVELCRGATTGTLSLAAGVGHTAALAAMVAAGCAWGVRVFRRKLAS